MSTQQNKFEETKEIIKYFLPRVTGKALDLGAGQAKYRSVISRAAKEYVAFDVAPGDKIDVVGDITKTGFADQSFDTIVCTQVFEHIATPWLAAAEISRILKPGGYCLVTAPFLQVYHADPHDYYRYTVDGMKALFEKGGLEIIECQAYVRFFMILSNAIHHTIFSPYKKKRLGADRIMRYFKKIARFLDRFVPINSIYGNVYIIVRRKDDSK